MMAIVAWFMLLIYVGAPTQQAMIRAMKKDKWLILGSLLLAPIAIGFGIYIKLTHKPKERKCNITFK